MLPLLVKQGFKGKIYSTPATRDVARKMLLDSASIQESDFLYLKKKRDKNKDHYKPIRSLDIPIAVFRNRTYSSLEVLVVYLKDKKALSFREIGLLLQRNERTIWTCYYRSQKKKLLKTISTFSL